MTAFIGVVATNNADADGERFSDKALRCIYEQAQGKPVTVAFDGPPIGSIVMSALHEIDNFAIGVQVLAEGEYRGGLYLVPQFSFDPATVTEEDGIEVYHEIKLMGFGLTHDPADRHLTPIVKGRLEV